MAEILVTRNNLLNKKGAQGLHPGPLLNSSNSLIDAK